MDFGTVVLYYNEKKGFIISAMARVKGPGFSTNLNPVMVADKDISDEKLGELVRENLKRSRNSGLVEREAWKNYSFWHVSGIKSFSAFSKKFSCVDIEEKAEVLEIIGLYRDASGAYLYSSDEIELSLDVSDAELGNILRQQLHTKDCGALSTNEFVSVFSDNKVRYQVPSDKFTDIGDAHTDAYQLYAHENDENTFFGFMIDSGYREISREGIRERWEKVYGALEEYKFKEQDDVPIKIIVSATAKTAYIKSYFWQDGKSLLEFFAQINIKNKTRQKQAEKEIKALIDSVEIIADNKENESPLDLTDRIISTESVGMESI